ncbi:Pleckstrin homology domain-containing family A member 6 [Bagarius yarrelli]|uniref:Pleckstrin homology domain-containing family A member 6 n=1 Tax=Bagarius yarrelli TaxID=175774 RepID=A0A556V3Y5_BAGYA|nr:Pleckstrin homology domain-containing family A member 6 [Bagarius yarrelli]
MTGNSELEVRQDCNAVLEGDIHDSQNEPNGPAGLPVIHPHLEENGQIQNELKNSDSDMNGKTGSRGPANSTVEANSNANNLSMASHSTPEAQNHSQLVSRTPKKAATFGKRSNSMRRNPKAEVTKQGWLSKQASSSVKQWNKRWFVLTDRCLFYYKDEKEEVVLGSLPLLSFKIGPVQPSDNISRKFAFKVWFEVEEEDLEGEMEERQDAKGSIAFCLQAEHAGTRTYYFSTESLEDREAWIQAMSEAAKVHILPAIRKISDSITEEQNHIPATPAPDSCPEEGDLKTEQQEPGKHRVNGVERRTIPASTTPMSTEMGSRLGEKGCPPPHHPNGWSNYSSAFNSQENIREEREVQPEAQENTVLRRGFVPRTGPERMAQRKSSMTQLQQWVNQRRGMTPQEDHRSPARYYTMNRGMSADYYSVYGPPQYPEEYPLYPPGIRPDSICSMSAAYDRMAPRWTAEEKRRSLRDTALYGPPREPQWMMGGSGPHPAYYTQLESTQGTMRRLSLQPRSRSVPRSPSSSSGGAYSPGPPSFISPARSPSVRFDRMPGRLQNDGIYADPSVYSMRRSLSSPKYDFPGDRRSLTQNVYHYNYPASPAVHGKMALEGDYLMGMVTRMVDRSTPRAKLFSQVPPAHDIYRDLHPTLKLNEIETSKLLNRLFEQNRLLKEQESVVHRLRMDKDNLEASLVATHQDMELSRTQPLAIEKLRLKKESLQNQLINVRGELSQASSGLTTIKMEFEGLEDEVNAIHGDLWEQLNSGGQNNPSRGTDTAKHRAVSAASGSFSTNSPASPLSSVSLTSPLSPFSSAPGSQNSPSKQLATEEIGPPRPPLPKSYQPLDPTAIMPPVPPLPYNSNAWQHSTDSYKEDKDMHSRKHNLNSSEERTNDYDVAQDKQGNKVGVVPPRTKSPADNRNGVHKRNGKVPNGHISRERPKSAVFPADVKSKMSVEEQNERIRRNQSSSVKDKRRSLNLSTNQNLEALKSSVNYRVVRRRVTAHEVDIKGLEAAIRGEGVESPREEIARLRRQVEPDNFELDISKELSAPEKVLIPERYLDIEPSTPLSPEEEKEKQKKVERIKTLIAKSNLQNIVPVLDGPTEVQANPEQKLQEQEKRIEISCALAAEASRRSRLLSGEEACRPEEPEQPLSHL